MYNFNKKVVVTVGADHLAKLLTWCTLSHNYNKCKQNN